MKGLPEMTDSPNPTTETVLILRTCSADMSAYGGFVWPESGPVECPDWDPAPECGNGLHGALWGEGNGSLLDWSEDARWLVVAVAAADIVDLGGKVKFPRGNVVYCGDRLGAAAYIQRPGRVVIGGTATAGDRGTATAGDRGTATAGDHGTATAGYYGTATAGDCGTATAGDGGTATAGYGSEATAGDFGAATAGYRGTATAGYGGTATAGIGGIATAGEGGVIQLAWWDGTRRRVAVGYVGEDGIRAGVAYRVVDGALEAAG